MRRTTIIFTGCLAAGALALAACSSDDGTARASGTAVSTTAASTTTVAATTTTAAATTTTSAGSTGTEPPMYPGIDDLAPGAQRLSFKYGPIHVEPGQNNIDLSKGQVPRPEVSGWITRIKPDIVRADGSVPPVDVIHLHHGVWLNVAGKDPTAPRLPERFFASGEEKTTTILPPGFGYRYDTSNVWVINYMIHNLLPSTDDVWLTYEVDIIPDTAPQAASIKAAHPVWMDVQNGSGYPVFDVIRGTGTGGRYTYPDDATNPYGGGDTLNRWTADRDLVVLATAGHLHPGGLQTNLSVIRDGKQASLYTSKAWYWEPAGAVSWDVGMTGTGPDYRARISKGDVLVTNATYDSKRASWYESMGIMVTWVADAADVPDAPDPFTTNVDVDGYLTHGPLKENDNHGGEPGALTDPTTLPKIAAPSIIPIADFVYGVGDYSEKISTGTVPVVKRGGTVTFRNDEPTTGNGIWHTITACKSPCNGSTGVAYPLADGDVTFDSGQLGDAGQPTAGRLTWDVPSDLPDGTYTYFCRVHPFMRGAFAVEG